MKKEIGKLVLVQERISEKKGLRSRLLPNRNQKKGPRIRKKNIKTQQSEKLVQTKILEIETQEHLVLIFFAHFAFCVFTKKISTEKN